jgi:glycosyltransferase involved in cell wall biosynthesis
MKPRVSICIPCFNAERWIAEAVRSALNQTWPEKEVIVVDDGSTDGSLAVLEKFGSAVRVLAGEHRGGNAARNLAWQSAQGEWIQFLDADDYLLPEKIARQFEEAPEGDVIFSPVLFENVDGRTPSHMDAAQDIHALWLSWQLPQTGGCLWRKSALERIGGWNVATRCCQEYELYLRAIEAGLQFSCAPTPNAVYRIWSEDTLCHKDPIQLAEVRTQLYQNHVQWLRERNLLQDHHLNLAGRAFFEMGRTLARYDLPKAAQYHKQKKREGLIRLSGPAAPLSYRAIYHVLGFSLAEKVAAGLRGGSD